MTRALFTPIFHAWMALFTTLLIGVMIWIFGSLLGLPSFFDESYRAYPSPLIVIFLVMIAVGIVTFITSFTRRIFFGAVSALIVFVLIVVVLLWIKWFIDTWSSTALMVYLVTLVGVAVGLVFLVFSKPVLAILVWLVVSVLVCFATFSWIMSTWGTSLLFYLTLVITVVVYVVVFALYVIIPNRISWV